MSESTTLDPLTAIRSGMLVAYHAQQRPDSVAVISNFGSRSFAELNARANQLARVLRNAGLKPDDSVAMLMTNRPEFLEIYYACQRSGLRMTPINWHLTGDNASYIVRNCEAKAFIADARCGQPAIDALNDNRDALLVALCTGGEIPGFIDYESMVESESGTNIDGAQPGTQMLYTSGTTGRPKGVYRPRPGVTPAPAASQTAASSAGPGQTAASATASGQTGATSSGSAAGYTPGTDLALCTGPAYHAAPLAFNVVSPISAGVGTVLMDKWDAEETLRLLQEHRITHTHMVATMFHRLLALPEDVRNKYELSSLRFVLHGAAPCPVHVKHAMMEWLGPVVYEYYAATEGGGGFFIGPEEWLQKPGSVGKTPANADNQILDDDGRQLPAGKVGTIYFRSPATRFEYFKDAEKTGKSYRGEHFTLGDMGYLDEDGYLFLTGRSAETIISGGVNVYPQETDDVLLKHPAVADCCTVGVPNEEWGEEVKSVVMLKDGIAADTSLAEELISFVREQLPAFKSPRTIEFTDDLPRLPSGKIQRRQVREPYWAGRDKQI
jgi:long-chain acyl-CoA synthetase